MVVQFPRKELNKIGREGPFQNLKSVKILQTLRRDNREFSLICRIELSDPSSDLEKVLSRNIHATTQVLERERDGAFILFIKGKPEHGSDSAVSFLKMQGGYPASFEMDEETITMTCIGDQSQLRKTLDGLEKSKLHFKIVSLMDPKFAQDSPLSSLTEKQRIVLINAYRLGYYDIPRKTSSEMLARKLAIHGSALVAHRRKAELNLIRSVLGEE